MGLYELENAPEMQKYPKTYVRDCLKKRWDGKSQFSVVFKPVKCTFRCNKSHKFSLFDFLRLIAATKFCFRVKDFQNNSPVHTKRFVAATCRHGMLLQLVA